VAEVQRVAHERPDAGAAGRAGNAPFAGKADEVPDDKEIVVEFAIASKKPVSLVVLELPLP
jgi:hypothetical protein